MAILEQIQKDMVAAMKARDEARLGAIRMIKAALMNEVVDKGAAATAEFFTGFLGLEKCRAVFALVTDGGCFHDQSGITFLQQRRRDR